MRRPLAALLVPAAVATVLVVATASPAVAAGERLVDIGAGFETPLLATAPDGEDDLYVVERRGVVRLVRFDGDGRVRSVTTFADIRDLVSTNGEGGLLGLAFSPAYASDGRVWLSYTDRTGGDSVVARYERDGTGTRIDESTRAEVIEVDQPSSRHNGGMIAFASDGMLLLGLGDGGVSADPYENGQDTSTLLGSVLRLDVKDRSGDGYGIPSDNPFVGREGRDEIWAYGVRNPYRFSVDRVTGDVWIADVGESAREEVNRLRYRPSPAVNLGWDRYEGTRCFESCGGTGGLTFPVHEYRHDIGCSVTGGYVVRGDTAPDLDGRYVFGDFCAGFVRVYDPATGGTRTIADDVGNVFGFGQDGLGTTYVLTATRVLRIAPSGTRFHDVLAESVFAADIEAIAREGITRGCDPPANTRFCPSDTVTREQMAAFIVRADGLARAPERFRDVGPTNVFARDIGGIAAAGITRGCNPPANDRYCPSRELTRGEMAALLVRTLDLPPARERFRDVATGDLFAADIGALAAAGITRGCNPPANDRFCPDDPVTRAQMAAFLTRGWGL